MCRLLRSTHLKQYTLGWPWLVGRSYYAPCVRQLWAVSCRISSSSAAEGELRAACASSCLRRTSCRCGGTTTGMWSGLCQMGFLGLTAASLMRERWLASCEAATISSAALRPKAE
eukprot:scaffold60194_cov67-Phaeocystis_antarctica.AAC.2